MERNFLLTIEYDGSDFSGWQRQPEARTVQGELERVLSKVCGGKVELNGTSRTDAGVHAFGQRASFKGEYGIPTDRIMAAANNCLFGGRRLGGTLGDVRIKALEEKPLDFHARFDSTGKKYRYVIQNGGEADIFRRNHCYYVPGELSVEAMKEAAGHIVGKHDFACFQSAGGQPRETTVRNVYSLTISEDKPCGADFIGAMGGGVRSTDATDFGAGGNGRDVVIEISGDGFLYNMVRIIAGTLVEVGLGKREPSNAADVIKSGDRRKAGHTAPPQGLYLMEVYY